MKPFTVTDKEKLRADRSIEGFPFTVVVRPQSEGGYLIVAVNPDTGLIILDGEFKGASERVKTKEDIGLACRRVLRNLDKIALFSTSMTNASRKRTY